MMAKKKPPLLCDSSRCSFSLPWDPREEVPEETPGLSTRGSPLCRCDTNVVNALASPSPKGSSLRGDLPPLPAPEH